MRGYQSEQHADEKTPLNSSRPQLCPRERREGAALVLTSSNEEFEGKHGKSNRQEALQNKRTNTNPRFLKPFSSLVASSHHTHSSVRNEKMTERIAKSVTDLIGGTPLVRLNKVILKFNVLRNHLFILRSIRSPLVLEPKLFASWNRWNLAIRSRIASALR